MKKTLTVEVTIEVPKRTKDEDLYIEELTPHIGKLIGWETIKVE